MMEGCAISASECVCVPVPYLASKLMYESLGIFCTQGGATLCPEVDHHPTEMTQIPIKAPAMGDSN